MFKFFPINGGVFMSVLCAIHCAVTPFVLSALPAFAGLWLSESLEWVMIGSGLFFSAYTLRKGYQQHQNPRPLQLLAVGGLFFLIANLFLHTHDFSWSHTLTNLCGGFFMILSQRINHTTKVSCSCAKHR